MITLRTCINVLPEKHKEVFHTLFALLQLSEKEKGCISYAIFFDIQDKNIFNLISEWETRHYLDQYMNSDPFCILLGIKSLLSEPLKSQILISSDAVGI